jgi:hypothetical protein
MTDGRPPPYDRHKLEALFKAAETRAPQHIGRGANDVDTFAGEHWRDPQRLASVANDELEKRRLRFRFLAPELATDVSWMILLDLFLASHRSQTVVVDGCGARWDVSDATAARYIAVLIEAGLSVRVDAGKEQRLGLLELTPRGEHIVMKTLALF